MQITKIAAAIALSTGLLAGCNTDLRDPVEPVEPPAAVSPLLGAAWDIGEAATATVSSLDVTDLPNVYVFSGTSQKYYNDDDDHGTYTLYSSEFEEDIDAGTITFNYYGNSEDLTDVTEVEGKYTVNSDGVLTITETNLGELIAADNSDDTAVADAITAANSEAGINGYVQILDTRTDDTGELRIKLSESTDVSEIASGKLTVDLVYQVDEDSEIEPTSKNAYISFYAEKTSNSNLHGEVAFEDGVIKYRDASGALTETDGTFDLGETLEVEVTWEPNSFSFWVNGTEYNTIDLPVADGTAVTNISLRLGDNSGTTHFELLGDNLFVYSNDTEADTLVLEEDFDSYAAGTDLSTIYNSNSSEAVVFLDGGDTDPEEPTEPGDITDNFDSYTVGTQIDAANSAYTVSSGVDGVDVIANISDDVAKSSSNSLYIADFSDTTKGVVSRAFAEGAAETGSVSTSVYIPADGYVKSTYLYLGGSNSGSSGERFTEVVFGGSDIKFRDETGSQVDLVEYTQDTWVDVEISWAPADDATYDITVTIDGDVFTSLKAENAAGEGPALFALYTGDNGSVGTYSYFDDLDSEQF
ncbi:hypothetical protein BCU68_12360 [Vibrio sp. 10N.286.49.B3]|nr:hypothetical protein BCU68_12360 [Vibrio sp. 10N.286.49.B3]